MDLSESAQDLMQTEQLNIFSIIDQFCEQCGTLTPHHIDESNLISISSSEETQLVPPISVHECVICREEEENLFNDFNSDS